MIHHLYVGHFERAGDCMKLEKRSDGRPWPMVVRPLDATAVRDVLAEFDVSERDIPEGWLLGIEEEGFIVCDAYPPNPKAIDFVQRLAKKTGCDVVYDGMVFFSPDELTISSEERKRSDAELAEEGKQKVAQSKKRRNTARSRRIS